MSEELYQAALVARAHAGRGRGRLAAPDRSITLDNPLCGDRVTLDLRLANGQIAAVGHLVRGCLLCEAGAETIAAHAPGKTTAELAKATANAGSSAKFEGMKISGITVDFDQLPADTPPHRDLRDAAKRLPTS